MKVDNFRPKITFLTNFILSRQQNPPMVTSRMLITQKLETRAKVKLTPNSTGVLAVKLDVI